MTTPTSPSPTSPHVPNTGHQPSQHPGETAGPEAPPYNPLSIGLRNIAAGVAGLIFSVILVLLIQQLSHWIYPPPAAFHDRDMDALGRWIMSDDARRPLMMVLMSYFVGSFGGVYLGLKLSANKTWLITGAVITFMIISHFMNMSQITHPVWFVVSGPIAAILAGLVGNRGGHTK